MRISRFCNSANIDNKRSNKPNFEGNPIIGLAAYLDERVLLGKAFLDVTALDAPQIIMANNGQERREKFNKASFSFILGYLSPLVTLPLTNRLGMKYIAKLTKSFTAKDANLIQLSNKYLVNAQETKKGVELLSKKLKTDYKPILDKVGGDYEVLRKKLINTKNSVLAFDLLFTAASIGCVGFFNNWQTKRKTNQDGFSAEFSMADKDTVEKRAENFKKKEPLRKAIWLGILAILTASPLLLKKGLTSQNATKFNNYMKKIASKFDYTDGIFMSRLPFFMSACAMYSGLVLASRNQTEMKDTSIRSTASTIAYFGGDILIGSILGRLSDKYLKTDLINKDVEKSFLNKLIPPTKRLRDLNPRDKKIGAALYWINLAMLSACMGFGIPYLINKMIRHDVEKDAGVNEKMKKLQTTVSNPIRMKDFIYK
ncbi:hypothetical protein IJ541_09200 [bacterium]|nr:hypothetical protein [bacterium]